MKKKLSQKTKNIFPLFLLLITSIFYFSSCSNSFLEKLTENQKETEATDDAEQTVENKKLNKPKCGYIRLTLKQEENSTDTSRTILPDINTANITSLTLSGLHNGETTTLGTWSSVTAFQADALPLDIGSWSLTLNAINETMAFSATASVTVELAQTHPVSFTLASDTNNGGIALKVNFTGDAVKATYRLLEYPSNTLADSGNLTITNGPSNKYIEYNRKTELTLLPNGIYLIELCFFGDAEGTIVLNNYSEIIRIQGGYISRAQRNIDLNQLFTITYDFNEGQIIGSSQVVQKYSVRSNEIALPDLQKTGYIFEGWYDSSDTLIGSITPSMACDIDLHAVFTIELKEGPAFNTVVKQWNAAQKFLPSATAPAGTVTNYLDTSTNVPVWYDSESHNVYFYAAGYTDSNGAKKLYLRPDSSKLFQDARYSEIDLSYFDTSRVTNMAYMFQGTSNLFNLDLTGFDTAHVTDMNHMFSSATNLHAIYVSNDFVTNLVTSDTYMFSGNSLLKGENNTAYSDANTGKTYARFDATGTPGYFSHTPAEDTYYISYVLNNGTNAAANPASYTSSSLPITLADPTGQNSSGDAFQFEGWYTTSNFAAGSQVTSIDDTSNGNFTLYAKWKVPYRVKHYFENAEDTNYSIAQDNTETKYGYAGNTTEAARLTSNSIVGTTVVLIAGFIEPTITQLQIEADGSTVVSIYYNRKTVTVTIDLDGGNIAGDTSDVVRSGKYGALMPAFNVDTVTKEGYTRNAIYQGSSIYAPGFTNYKFQTENTSFRISWTRDDYTITYNRNGGTFASTPVSTYSVDTATFSLPVNITKTGYTFQGWFSANDANGNGTGTQTSSITLGSTGNVTVYAKWAPATDTAYTVKHMQQNTSGSNYSEVTEDTQTLTGTTGDSTDATAKTYIGFTAQPVSQETIAPDGTTVVIIQYNRNTYSVTYDDGVTTEEIDVPSTMTGVRFGANVTPTYTGITRTGYTFAGWKYGSTTYKSSGTSSFTMPNSAVTLTAQWTANTNTQYTVKHMQQDTTGDGYTELTSARQTKTGTTGGTTSAAANNYTGFTAQTVSQKTIAADGSTVVEVKYNRKTYNVTYSSGVSGGSVTVPSTMTGVRYGATVTPNYTNVSRAGYAFTGWFYGSETYTSTGTSTFEMPNNAVTLTAQWEMIDYEIVYHLNGGSFISSYTAPTTYNASAVTQLATTQKIRKTDMLFDGWYADSSFSGSAISSLTTTTGPANANSSNQIHLYAKWKNGVVSATSSNATEKIAEIIANGDSGAVVKITGSLTADQLQTIADSFKTQSGTNVMIGLDLSGTTLTEIPASAFFQNYKLSSIVLPSSLTTIGDSAFHMCGNSNYRFEIDIPASVTTIGSRALNGGFSAINVASGNANYSSVDGCLCNKAGTTLIEYPAGKETVDQYTIPSSVTTIGRSAFAGKNNIVELIIPSTVTEIGQDAFNYNTAHDVMTKVKIIKGSSKLKIGYHAFSQDYSLNYIEYTGTKAQFESSTYVEYNGSRDITYSDYEFVQYCGKYNTNVGYITVKCSDQTYTIIATQ